MVSFGFDLEIAHEVNCYTVVQGTYSVETPFAARVTRLPFWV
jgi:hypothetical protein